MHVEVSVEQRVRRLSGLLPAHVVEAVEHGSGLGLEGLLVSCSAACGEC